MMQPLFRATQNHVEIVSQFPYKARNHSFTIQNAINLKKSYY